MSALEDAALAYAQQGLHVFPLQPNGKTPLTAHGLDDATIDPMTIETWWSRRPDANIAIRTGDVVVVDEDKLGALDDFALSIGERLPETRIAQTANGRHFYFTQPEGQRVRNTAGKLAEGIDTRGDGGYVVAPPSLHPSGEAYTWISEVDLAPLPNWVAERVVRQQPERRPLPADVSFGPGTTPYGQRSLDEELNSVANAVEGTRNDTLNTASFAIGQLVAGGEIDHHDAYASLEAAANSAGLPPIEAAKTIRSGFTAGQGDPRTAPETNGHVPARHLRAVPETPHVQPAAGERLIITERYSAFRAQAEAPQSFIIDDLWPVQQLGFIASPPKKGKTWVALALALSVATGSRFLDQFDVPERRRVLYLALEGGRTPLNHRLGCLARGMDVDPECAEIEENLILSYRPRGIDLADPIWASDLSDVVSEENVELVIVDVLRAAARFKENDASDFASLRHNLEETLKKCSIGILHHFTKLSEVTKERSPAERMSGSGAMYGALDIGMFITGNDSDNSRKLRIEFDGRDLAMPDPLSVYLDGTGSGPNGGFVYTDTAYWRADITDVPAERVRATDSIITYLENRGGEARVGEISDAVKAAGEGGRSTVERRLKELVTLGRIFNRGRGFYSLSPQFTLQDSVTTTSQGNSVMTEYGEDPLNQAESPPSTVTPSRSSDVVDLPLDQAENGTTSLRTSYGGESPPASDAEELTAPEPSEPPRPDDLDWS